MRLAVLDHHVAGIHHVDRKADIALGFDFFDGRPGAVLKVQGLGPDGAGIALDTRPADGKVDQLNRLVGVICPAEVKAIARVVQLEHRLPDPGTTQREGLAGRIDR